MNGNFLLEGLYDFIKYCAVPVNVIREILPDHSKIDSQLPQLLTRGGWPWDPGGHREGVKLEEPLVKVCR